MRIEGDGFLEDGCLEKLGRFEGINSNLFNVLIELNNFSENLKNKFNIEKQESPKEKQKVIAVVAFIRLLEIIQATIILSSHGIREELHSLFRIFLDSYFVLVNCCSDPSFISTYFLSDEPSRLKLMNSASKHKSDLFKKINEYASKEIKEDLDKKVKHGKIQAFNSFLYAKNVGCEEIYDSLYRLKSASIHTTPGCLDHYVETDSSGNIILLKHHPNPEETNHCIFDISYYFIKAISGICELFSLEYEDQLKDFQLNLDVAASSLDKT